MPTYRRSVIPTRPGASALPLVAIVGRPNVGKSTLFNRLTKSRRSIVGDEPGITRDRIYGEFDWAGRRFRLVDTGGIIPDDPELIPTEIFNQAKVALEEAEAPVSRPAPEPRGERLEPDGQLLDRCGLGGRPDEPLPELGEAPVDRHPERGRTHPRRDHVGQRAQEFLSRHRARLPSAGWS